MTGLSTPNSPQLPCVAELKEEARQLRATSSFPLTHAQALEKIAQRHGFRNWNVLAAKARRRPTSNRLVAGMKVRGLYLSQAFSGKILSVTPTEQVGFHRLTLHFDEAVDVVTFDSFSAYRQRVTCTIGPDGTSPDKTSDGAPHMRLKL